MRKKLELRAWRHFTLLFCVVNVVAHRYNFYIIEFTNGIVLVVESCLYLQGSETEKLKQRAEKFGMDEASKATVREMLFNHNCLTYVNGSTSALTGVCSTKVKFQILCFIAWCNVQPVTLSVTSYCPLQQIMYSHVWCISTLWLPYFHPYYDY